MSSISQEIANNIIKNNGYYVAGDGERDPQFFAVFKIQNSYFGHVHICNCYSLHEFLRYEADHKVVEILWSKRKISLNDDGVVVHPEGEK